MTAAVAGNSIVDAWKAASQKIMDAASGNLHNLIVEIENPLLNGEQFRLYDSLSVGSSDRVSVVAKVLFPSRKRPPDETRQQFYDYWLNVLNTGRRKRGARKLRAPWGTYFARLVSFNNTENQVERIIQALANWGRRYETALVAHLSAPTLDHPRPRGGPCLQYLEVLWGREDIIDLVAVYRNHDYLNKALGNFVGLANLLSFLATESGKKPGRIICHSVNAYCGSRPKLRLLIER